MKNFALLMFIALIIILSGCSDDANSQTGPFPATEIFFEEPVMIGHIIEVLEEEQVIYEKSGITKEEAIESHEQGIGYNTRMFFSNATTFDGELKKGYKVAIWEFEEQMAKYNNISERIIVLEK